MADNPPNQDVLGLTAQIVSAHVSNNSVSPDALPSLIQQVYKTLSGVGKEPMLADRPQPSVPVKKSVFPDHIICLEDGKKLKMLKRHLKTAYNMTPEQYRDRWGLGPDTRWWRRIMRGTAPRSPRRSASEPSHAPPAGNSRLCPISAPSARGRGPAAWRLDRSCLDRLPQAASSFGCFVRGSVRQSCQSVPPASPGRLPGHQGRVGR